MVATKAFGRGPETDFALEFRSDTCPPVAEVSIRDALDSALLTQALTLTAFRDGWEKKSYHERRRTKGFALVWLLSSTLISQARKALLDTLAHPTRGRKADAKIEPLKML